MPDPRCKEIFATLSQYLDGELPARNCRELERHLRGCKPCIAYLQNLKTTIQACRRYRVQKAPRLSARIRRLLLEALRQSS